MSNMLICYPIVRALFLYPKDIREDFVKFNDRALLHWLFLLDYPRALLYLYSRSIHPSSQSIGAESITRPNWPSCKRFAPPIVHLKQTQELA
ncbi:hypothetical protein SLE2022_009350 [Rubroshorea leprosula]